jgi:hypothetical protein
MALREAGKPPADGSPWNRAGKDTLAESAKLALEDEEFENMIPIDTAAAISVDHQEAIDTKLNKAVTKSLLADQWDTAMTVEFHHIGHHQVFGDFMEIPEGKMALASHWVYTIERNGAGNVQGFKARLVCVEYCQIEDIDFQATYASTARMGHGWLGITKAKMYDLEIHLMDNCMAFLGVDLEEAIYLHPPQRYVHLLPNGTQYNNP